MGELAVGPGEFVNFSLGLFIFSHGRKALA